MEHRTAIVTGGSRGPRPRPRPLSSPPPGGSVVTDGRDADRPAAPPPAASPAVVAIAGDVTDAGHRAALVGRRRPDRSTSLVNNAGGLGPSPLPALADYPLDALADLFAVNVVAPLGLVQAALPHLRATGPSSSTSPPTRRSRPTRAGAATAPPRRRSTSSAGCSPPSDPDLRVLTVDPGDMRTQMHQDAFPGEDISDRPLPEDSVPGILAARRRRRAERPLPRRRRWSPHERRPTALDRSDLATSSCRPSWRRPSRRS